MKEIKRDGTQKDHSLLKILGMTVLVFLMLVSMADAASFNSGTWKGQGTYYDGKSPFDMNLTVNVQGNTFSGTLEETVYDGIVNINGNIGDLSSFSSFDQKRLNTVVKKYGTGTGKFVVFTDPSSKKGLIALNCVYYAVVNSDNSLKGIWAYPTTTSSTGDGTLILSPSSTKIYAYITNDDGTVSVIDTTSDTVAATIKVGNDPYGVAVTKDGKKVYVTDYKAYKVSAIDTTTNKVTSTVPVGKTPVGVAVTPDGKKTYVANEADNTVSVIDTATNKAKTTVKVGSNPYGISVAPDGKKVYVTNSGGSTVSIVDTTTNKVTSTISGLSYPGGITINPTGTAVYVSSGNANVVYVIDTATNKVKAKIGVGKTPVGVAVSPDGTKVYVANNGDNTVSIIDTSTNKVKATVKVGSGPYGVSVTPDGTKVYVANRLSNSVSIIDTATNKVKTTVKVGNHPKAFGQSICTVS